MERNKTENMKNSQLCLSIWDLLFSFISSIMIYFFSKLKSSDSIITYEYMFFLIPSIIFIIYFCFLYFSFRKHTRNNTSNFFSLMSAPFEFNSLFTYFF